MRPPRAPGRVTSVFDLNLQNAPQSPIGQTASDKCTEVLSPTQPAPFVFKSGQRASRRPLVLRTVTVRSELAPPEGSQLPATPPPRLPLVHVPYDLPSLDDELMFWRTGGMFPLSPSVPAPIIPTISPPRHGKQKMCSESDDERPVVPVLERRKTTANDGRRVPRKVTFSSPIVSINPVRRAKTSAVRTPNNRDRQLPQRRISEIMPMVRAKTDDAPRHRHRLERSLTRMAIPNVERSRTLVESPGLLSSLTPLKFGRSDTVHTLPSPTPSVHPGPNVHASERETGSHGSASTGSLPSLPPAAQATDHEKEAERELWGSETSSFQHLIAHLPVPRPRPVRSDQADEARGGVIWDQRVVAERLLLSSSNSA